MEEIINEDVNVSGRCHKCERFCTSGIAGSRHGEDIKTLTCHICIIRFYTMGEAAKRIKIEEQLNPKKWYQIWK